MKRALMCVLALMCVGVSSPLYAQQQKIDNPYGRDVEFTVVLRERNSIIGELPLHIAKDGALSVNGAAFVSALTPRIIPQAAQALLQLPTIDNRVSFEHFSRLGYELTFNINELELSVTLPLTARPRLDYSVMGAQREELGDFDRVAPFSLAVNFRLVSDYNHNDFGDNLAASGTFSLLGRAGPIAYQSNYRMPSGQSAPLREGSRVIVDDVKRALRWQVGDIRPFSASPVGGDDILGFGVSRETDTLQPDHIVRVRGTQTFSIEENSEVTISVNGRVITRRMFAPGNYNIADFPFVLGRNQIELLILTSSGEQQRLSFNQFLDSRLLESGRDDFGFSFGIASQPGLNQSRQYQDENWVLNAHYISGLSENLTLGLATTVNQQRGIVMATGVHAGSLGITSGRIGLNISDAGSKIANIGLGVVRTINDGLETPRSRTLRIGLDSRIDLNDTQKTLVNASLSYAWPLTPRVSASADVRVSGRNYSVGFQSSYSLPRDIRLDASIDWRINKVSGQSGPSISLSLSRSFGVGGQARSTYDSRIGEGRFGVSHTPIARLGAWSNAVEIAKSSRETNITSTQSVLYNRLELATSAGANWRDNRASQRLGMSVGSAFAFANGQFAWGRPVSDSFAIIKGHKTLDGRQISLDSRGSQNGPMARTGLWGPALISGLGTYAGRVVSVAVDDPPLGYDIGSGTFRVSPPLYGGYGFVVGSDVSTTVVGTLLLYNGQPASLLAGVATSKDWPNAAPITVFTNANGQFSATGLGQGRWSLKMRGLSGTFDFVVGTGDTNLLQLGNISVTGLSGATE